MTVLCLNGFPSLASPWFSAGGGVGSFVRPFAAYWIAMFAAGGFIFCCVLSVQGLAQLLPRQQFLRVSSVLQLAFFCLLLFGRTFFLLVFVLDQLAVLTDDQEGGFGCPFFGTGNCCRPVLV